MFFVIYKSENDRRVSWPFRKKVTIILVNQLDKDKPIVDAFRPDPTSNSFQEPKNFMNIGSGFPVLIPLAKLLDESNGYKLNDEVRIKCVVDTYDCI